VPRFPSPGSSRVEFPGFLGTIKALRLPAVLPAALRFLRLAVPRVHSVDFAPAATECQAASLGLVARYPHPGFSSWRRQDLPSSWGTPIPVCTCSQTPAGRCAPDRYGTLAWPPLLGRRRRRRTIGFRGSIAWLSGSLPTYHQSVARLTAQGWLPGAGQALLDGPSPAGFQQKVFQLTSCQLSSSSKLLGTTQVPMQTVG
jgi:hypothetical protein